MKNTNLTSSNGKTQKGQHINAKGAKCAKNPRMSKPNSCATRNVGNKT